MNNDFSINSRGFDSEPVTNDILRTALLRRRREAIHQEYLNPNYQIERKLLKDQYFETKRQGKKWNGHIACIPPITNEWLHRYYPEIFESETALRRFLKKDEVLKQFIIDET